MTSQPRQAELLLRLRQMQIKHRKQQPTSAAQRIDRLNRLLAMLDKYAEQFCVALDSDYGGRSHETSLMNDLMATAGSIKYARGQVRKWMRPDRRQGIFPFNLFGNRVEVVHQAKGVVGILGTWNVPLFTTLAPLASVIAAGNAALIRPSELTPATSALLAQAVEEYFDPDELSIVLGGPEVAAEFSSLPFDHLVLTGSTQVGRKVMQAAASNLVPVTLELGGKSPVIIGRSADIDQAAERIVLGKCMNGGQICVTPDVIHVPVEKLEQFIDACSHHFRRFHPGGSGLTSIINQLHHQRLCGYLDELQQRGCRIVDCGEQAKPLTDLQTLRLVISPDADSQIANAEIFGPILQLETFQRTEDAVERINAGDRPLALYYFGKDRQEEQWVLEQTLSGGVAVNDVLLHVAAHDAPFGGIGPSGMGVYHGREGFETFTHPRTICRSGWLDPRKAFGLLQPYSAKFYKQLRGSLSTPKGYRR